MTRISQGDLIYVNFDPQSGHEQAGKRPCIVLSPDIFNEYTHFIIVCPITSKKKNYPFEVPLPDGLKINGVILTDQIKSIDKNTRFLNIVDSAPNSVINECLDKVYAILPRP